MMDRTTGKAIGALAPAFNPERFTDPATGSAVFDMALIGHLPA